ncbi:MAG: hypothetical protein KF832_26430 [Caldilineaceae bacterium]|nr:hypothetical protein [Caldilineaceae bacterium]
MTVLRRVFKAICIVGTLLFISAGVSAAGRADLLTVVALPMALLLMMVWRLLGPRAELVAWTLLVLWLGLTYVNPADAATLPRELAVAASYALLAALGLFVSPWFLAVGLVAHIGWDFVPRELPTHLHDLPTACLIYDGVLAIYGGWQTYTGRWTPLRLKGKAPPVSGTATVHRSTWPDED